MAICPFARVRLLPESHTQRRIVPTQAIAHTAVDAPGPTDLVGYFGRSDVGTESHFWVDRDGVIWQMMDTGREADANRTADIRAISYETEDDSARRGGDILPWSTEQLDAIIRLNTWLVATHAIPARLCPAHDAPGLGWHSMWGFRDPIAQTGAVDNPWSHYRGKTCPGRARIAQFREIVVPAVVAAAGRPRPKEPAVITAADLTADTLAPPPGAPGLTVDARTRTVQHFLADRAAELGNKAFDPGGVDGQYGPATGRAVDAWRTHLGLGLWGGRWDAHAQQASVRWWADEHGAAAVAALAKEIDATAARHAAEWRTLTERARS